MELETVLNAEFAPVISNVTAEKYSTKNAALTLLKSQLTSPVLYKQSVLNAEKEAEILAKIATRAAAKKAKDFATADRIRGELLAEKIALLDTPFGTIWEAVD